MPATEQQKNKLLHDLKVLRRHNPRKHLEIVNLLQGMAAGGEGRVDKRGNSTRSISYRRWQDNDFASVLDALANSENVENELPSKEELVDLKESDLNKDEAFEDFKIKSCVKISPINHFFDQIYLLNLNERSDRFFRCQKIFKKHGIIFKRFSAINGKNLNSDFLKNYQLNAPEIGCLLSHYEIIEDAKKNNFKKILIFEDDVILQNDFTSTFLKNLQELENDWKLLYLGCSQHDWKNIEFYKNKFYFSNQSLGAFAYAVDHSIYEEILSTKNIHNLPFDNILSLIQISNYKNCFTIFPNIVCADVSNSDIRKPRDQAEHSIKMKWNLIPEKNPFFSIIIPNHRDDFLQETIDSVKNQSLKDFECIIVNDIPSKFKNFDDDRIKIYDRPNFLSSNANSCRNYGINLSSGKYIIFLDSDDILDIDCLSNRKKAIEKNPNFESYIFYTEHFKSIPGDMPGRLVNKNSKYKNYLEDFLSYNLLWPITSCTWKRETLISLGGFNEDLHRLQDVDLHIRLLANKNNKIFINNQKNPDNFYRNSEFFSNLNSEKKLKIQISLENLMKSYENSSIKLKNEFINQIEKIIEKKKFKINDYFDQIYCLNLDKRPDRMERMKKRFEYFGIEFKRFSAVNGKVMSNAEYSKYKLYKKKLSKTELACTLSHKKIYEDALEKGYEKILVFEDDAKFVSNFLNRIQEIEKFDWDFVLLGSSQLDQIPKVKNGFYHPNERTWGTFAYAIRRKCFERIIQLMEKNGMYVADGYWWDYTKEHSNCFVYFPNICIAEVHDSDIRNKFNQNDYNKKTKWDLIVEDII